MSKNPKFFRADEDRDLSDKTTPSPGEWFGPGRAKYKEPAQAADGLAPPRQKESYDGWRQFFKGTTPRDPLWNPLMTPENKEEAIRFRDRDSDKDRMVYVLENAAEILEDCGHIDLAAECESICELLVDAVED